jgi:hypothetical protein
MDVYQGMADYESGDTSVVTDAVYQKLQTALTGCHTIFGESYDYKNVTSSSSQSVETDAEQEAA